jgi:hypothetical protein
MRRAWKEERRRRCACDRIAIRPILYFGRKLDSITKGFQLKFRQHRKAAVNRTAACGEDCASLNKLDQSPRELVLRTNL